MKQGQLIPKPPKRMKQPRKNDLRWRMELAEAQLAFDQAPLWVRVVRPQLCRAAELPRHLSRRFRSRKQAA